MRVLSFMFAIASALGAVAVPGDCRAGAEGFDRAWIALREMPGTVEIARPKGEILLRTRDAVKEDVLQEFVDKLDVTLRFFCEDPNATGPRVTLVAKGADVPSLLQELLGPGYRIARTESGREEEGSKEAGSRLDVHPESCDEMEEPIRVIRRPSEIAVLSSPPEALKTGDLMGVMALEGPAGRLRALALTGSAGEEVDVFEVLRRGLRDANPTIAMPAARKMQRLARTDDTRRGEVALAIRDRVLDVPYVDLVWVLAQMDRDLAWPFVEQMMALPDENAQRGALTALVLSEDARGVPWLAQLARATGPGVDGTDIRRAVLTLGKIGGTDAASTLVELLREGDANQQAIAVQGVALLGEEDRTGAELEIGSALRRKPFPESLAAALVYLGYMPPLERLFLDPTTTDDTKRAMLRLIVSDGGKNALGTIDLGLREKSPTIRAEAVGAVVAIGGEDAIPMLAALVRDPDQGVRLAVISAFREYNPTVAVIDALVEATRDGDTAVRKEAIDVMSSMSMPSSRTFGILQDIASNSQDPYVAERAASTVERYEGLKDYFPDYDADTGVKDESTR